MTKPLTQLMIEYCPVCLVANPDDAHLMREYTDMQAARWGMFKNAAATAQDVVASLLLARGITHIPNLFGDIPVMESEKAE